MTKTYEELKTRLASIHDLHMARSILGWDQHTKMPPKGGEVRAEQLGTLDRFVARALHRRRDRPPPRGAPRLRGGSRPGLARGEPDPDHAPRLREGEARPVGASRRDDPRRRDRAAPLDRGAREVRLLDLPPVPGAQRRAHARVHRVLRRHGLRVGVRRRARRLRRGHDLGRRPCRLRRAQARAGPAHRADSGALRPGRGLVAARRLPDREATGVRARGGGAVRLRPRELAARPDGASLCHERRHQGHPH